MSPWIWCIPVISACIGWFVNRTLLKMLFHPKQPRKILGLTFHGIIPKKQPELAKQLGQLVSTQLFSFGDIKKKITQKENIDKILPQIEGHIDHFLRTKLGTTFPMLSMFIGDKTITQMKGAFMSELEIILPEVLKSYVGNLQKDLDLEKIITEKVQEFSPGKLETALNDILKKELNFIKISGAVLGFTIGLLQILLTWLINY
jgi:uncharacterized membrane protein YheB (UPF0754 family)